MKNLSQFLAVLLLLLSPVLLAACFVACATGGSYGEPHEPRPRFAHLESAGGAAPGQLSLVTDPSTGALSFPARGGELSPSPEESWPS